jgi:hypothetical protein
MNRGPKVFKKTLDTSNDLIEGVLNLQAATCGGDCTNCCGYSAFSVSPTPGFCVETLTAQCGAQATYCTGQVYFFTTTSSWSSSNTSILTVNNTTQKGVVTGVSPGTANVTAVFPLVVVYTGTICGGNPCPTSTPAPVGSVTVQRPGFVELASDISARDLCSNLGFPGNTFNTYIRKIKYRVLDTARNPISKSGLTISETLTVTNNGCGSGPSPGSWTTDSSGTMTQPDFIFNCSLTCYYGGNCTEAWDQYFRVLGFLVQVRSGTTEGSHNAVSVNCTGYPTIDVTN